VNKIGNILKELTLDGERIKNYYSSIDLPIIDWCNNKNIEQTFVNNKEFGLFINTSETKDESLIKPGFGISIYNNKDSINLELSFSYIDLENKYPKKIKVNLMNFTKYISQKYGVEEFYCGIEPAEDKDTQLFSYKSSGSYKIDD